MTLGTENDVARAWVAAMVLMFIVALFFVLARTLGKSKSARR
jgi:ABC-type phosphate transport system permease subunit